MCFHEAATTCSIANVEGEERPTENDLDSVIRADSGSRLVTCDLVECKTGSLDESKRLSSVAVVIAVIVRDEATLRRALVRDGQRQPNVADNSQCGSWLHPTNATAALERGIAKEVEH